ncbi:S-layer homology domain-containing protein [Patescibacteria group bacterium]|nr:S-layer homology domain-containing protein [Patescibacteria group bacterium]
MKKILLVFLVVFLQLSTVSAQSFSVETTELFKDLKENASIKYLKDLKIIQGYEDGTFKPDAKINRAELAKILIAVNKNPDIATNKDCFNDVREEWFAPYICYAKKQSLVKGYDNDEFKPSNNVNRAEALKMIVGIVGDLRLNEFDNIELNFNDVPEDAWFTPYVKIAAKRNILGQVDGDLRPSDDITRLEASEWMARLMVTRYLGTQKFNNDMEFNFSYNEIGALEAELWNYLATSIDTSSADIFDIKLDNDKYLNIYSTDNEKTTARENLYKKTYNDIDNISIVFRKGSVIVLSYEDEELGTQLFTFVKFNNEQWKQSSILQYLVSSNINSYPEDSRAKELNYNTDNVNQYYNMKDWDGNGRLPIDPNNLKSLAKVFQSLGDSSSIDNAKYDEWVKEGKEKFYTTFSDRILSDIIRDYDIEYKELPQTTEELAKYAKNINSDLIKDLKIVLSVTKRSYELHYNNNSVGSGTKWIANISDYEGNNEEIKKKLIEFNPESIPLFSGDTSSTFIYDTTEIDEFDREIKGSILTPIILSENTAIFAGHYPYSQGKIHAINYITGESKWKHSFSFDRGGSISPPLDILVAANGVVYHTNYDSNNLVASIIARDISSGDLKWEYITDSFSVIKSLIIDDNILYYNDHSGIYALDVTNNKIIWSLDKVKYSIEGYPASFTVSNDTIFVGGGDKYLYALDKQNGNLKWTYKTDFGLSIKPLIDNTNIYITSGDTLYSLNKSTGTLNWLEIFYKGISNYKLFNNTIYVDGGLGIRFAALDSETGEIKFAVSDYVMSDETTDNKIFLWGNCSPYYGCSDDYIYSFDLEKEEIEWKLGIDNIYKSPAKFIDKGYQKYFSVNDSKLFLNEFKK